MVRLRPHRQTLVTRSFGAYSKLGKRYYGPYQVVARIRGAAYKLYKEEKKAHTTHLSYVY